MHHGMTNRTTVMLTCIKRVLKRNGIHSGHKAGNVLTRSEIVTLINTFNRLSESISAIERFGVMYKQRLEKDQLEAAQDNLDQKGFLPRINRRVSVASSRLNSILDSRNITLHRTALKSLASWIN